MSHAPDPFDLLNLPPTFDLDAGALHRAWLSASARLHPDRAGPGTSEMEEAQRLSMLAAINRAKAVLADPIQRAEALLARLGGPLKENDKSLPDGFLMEMLEVREQLEEATANRHPEEITRWEAWAGDRRRDAIERVKRLFESGALTDIRQELNAWRYIERMIEQLPPPD